MALGGNKKLKEFFGKYGINEEPLANKYKTKASMHYRLLLRCENENMPFHE